MFGSAPSKLQVDEKYHSQAAAAIATAKHHSMSFNLVS